MRLRKRHSEKDSRKGTTCRGGGDGGARYLLGSKMPSGYDKHGSIHIYLYIILFTCDSVLSKSCQIFHLKYLKPRQNLYDILKTNSKTIGRSGSKTLKLIIDVDDDNCGTIIVKEPSKEQSTKLEYCFEIDKHALIIIGNKTESKTVARWLARMIHNNNTSPIPLADMCPEKSKNICDKLIRNELNKIIEVDFTFNPLYRYHDCADRLLRHLVYSKARDVCIVTKDKVQFEKEYEHCANHSGLFLFDALIFDYENIKENTGVGYLLRVKNNYSFSLRKKELTLKEWRNFCNTLLEEPVAQA